MKGGGGGGVVKMGEKTDLLKIVGERGFREI